MREPIQCVTHGQQRRAFVCSHILDAAKAGFVWQRDGEGEYEALCTACSKLSPDQWSRQAPQVGRAICLQCFAELGRRNGITWPAGAGT